MLPGRYAWIDDDLVLKLATKSLADYDVFRSLTSSEDPEKTKLAVEFINERTKEGK